MVKLATLGKIAVGLTFPLVGAAYYTQHRVKSTLIRQSYYAEALALLKAYEPVVSRLGEPIEIKPLDISDKFNYQDEQRAQVKIPLEGKRRSAFMLVKATRVGDPSQVQWRVDTLELAYPSFTHKFYDASLINNKEAVATAASTDAK